MPGDATLQAQDAQKETFGSGQSPSTLGSVRNANFLLLLTFVLRFGVISV